MDYTKSMHSFVITIFICLISTVAVAQEAKPNSSDMYEYSTDTKIVEGKESKWQLSILAGGVSKHLTNEYEPSKGYTETHSSLGLEIAQAGPGWTFSAQAFRFNDSYDKNSFLGFGAFGYRAMLPYQFFIYAGAGIGTVNTSYYSGAIALPLLKLGWSRVSVQASYLPKLQDTDEVIAVQFNFKVIEW